VVVPVDAKDNREHIYSGLRLKGGILLVSCYELGHQPLTLASPYAHLTQAGFAPATLDTSVEALDAAAVRAAGLVAISVPMHTALRLGAAIAARVREINPDAHICFYGLYANLNVEYLLGTDRGDSVIGGEFETPLVELARALDGSDVPRFQPIDVVGVGTRTRPEPPVLQRPEPVVPLRQELPPLRSYAGLERDGTIVPAGYVEATRGCHHTCRHCPITPVYGGRLAVVPRHLVLEDARRQIAAGARHITFGDPDFFNGPAHSLRICRELQAEFPGLTFDATIKVEHLLEHRKRLPELTELGCAFVVSAVESLSDEVLLRLDKGHTRRDIEEALSALDNVGVPMRPSLLPFSPWENLDGYRELLRWIAEGDLYDNIDPVMMAIRLLIPPGSAILDDPDRDAWLGDLDAEAFTYRWTHPDPRMDRLYRDVSIIVEEATRTMAPNRDTYARIWAATYAVDDEREAPPLPRPKKIRPKPPRLTESWFC
jgi:radical SAM superfamily enzyme YgiQ (UPF0313 family)